MHFGEEKWKFFIVRVVCDLTVALSGFALGAVLGIGTVVTAFGMGPMISFLMYICQSLSAMERPENLSCILK